MTRREAPETAEGWYALHDLRRVDWDAWRAAPERERRQAVAEGVDYLQRHEALVDAEAGGSAAFSVLGHGADLLVLHLRPTTADLDVAQRSFEGTALAAFTERADSYVSVTEVSGYAHEDVGDGLEAVDDEGLRRYLGQRLYPEIPDDAHVCFYPMDKRRGPDHNWYDLPFEDRAEHMSSHGDIGRSYAGAVTQIITGSVGLDDHEWGITLFADDLTDVKELLYEMRFDQSTSLFAEFGDFYVGRRFPPSDLGALLAGQRVPTDGNGPATEAVADAAGAEGEPAPAATEAPAGGEGGPDDAGPDADSPDTGGGDDGDEGGAPGRPDVEATPHEEVDPEDLERRLRELGLDVPESAGYGLVFTAEADAEDLVDDVADLRENFEHYDTHETTTVRATSGESVVVSLWANQRAADTASGFLGELDGVHAGVGAPLGDDSEAGDGDGAGDDAEEVRETLADLDVYAGQPHGEDVHAMVVYSDADPADLADAVADLREGFDRYDTHRATTVYGARAGDRRAVVSLWDTADAADTAAEYLEDLPAVVARAGDGSGFGTMGMFYTVEPEHREDFVEKFETVGELLADMEGHRRTDLMVNAADDNDMFIASQWRSREDAMAFFRSDAFADAVDWGRDVLADRPRHVFLS